MQENDFLTLLTKDGNFDKYLNFMAFVVILIMSFTMICCVLCFFSNYEMPRKTIAREQEYYREMASRVEMKN